MHQELAPLRGSSWYQHCLCPELQTDSLRHPDSKDLLPGPQAAASVAVASGDQLQQVALWILQMVQPQQDLVHFVHFVLVCFPEGGTGEDMHARQDAV